MFRSMPVLLLSLLILVICADPYLSLPLKQGLYALSLTVKSIIVFMLPVVIFCLLFNTITGLSRRATHVIGLIILCVCCSNYLSTFLSHYVGEWVYHLNLTIIEPKTDSGLTALWSWVLPKWIDNNKALMAGILGGWVAGYWLPDIAQTLASRLETLANRMLKSFLYLIPLFVVGFVVKLHSDGVIQIIIHDYALIFALVACAQFGYLIFLYSALNHFNIKQTISSLRQMLPAAIAGFSTMSSAAVMPLTLMGVEANAKNKDLTKAVVPVTVNIHLLGDCFAIPIFAYALMKSFAMPEPTLAVYLIFVVYFVIAKFSVAAIPGGGIMVMLPVLEGHLGFNGEMLSLITALYILFDPVITCANVLGNGALAKFIDKITSLRTKSVDAIVHT